MNLLNKKHISKLTSYFLILSFGTFISFSITQAQDDTVKSESGWYHEFARKLAAGSARSQLMVNLQIDRDISQDNVKEVMLEEFKKLRVDTVPQFGTPPSSIYIYVYEKRDDPKVQWLGLLTWDNRKIETPRPDPDSIEPTISLNRDKISIIEKRTGIRFGLSEETRVSVFNSRAIIILKNKSYADSTRPITDDSLTLALHEEATAKIFDQLERSLATQYNLTKDMLKQIYNEGLQKGWPLPPEIDRSLLKREEE